MHFSTTPREIIQQLSSSSLWGYREPASNCMWCKPPMFSQVSSRVCNELSEELATFASWLGRAVESKTEPWNTPTFAHDINKWLPLWYPLKDTKDNVHSNPHRHRRWWICSGLARNVYLNKRLFYGCILENTKRFWRVWTVPHFREVKLQTWLWWPISIRYSV